MIILHTIRDAQHIVPGEGIPVAINPDRVELVESRGENCALKLEHHDIIVTESYDDVVAELMKRTEFVLTRGGRNR